MTAIRTLGLALTTLLTLELMLAPAWGDPLPQNPFPAPPPRVFCFRITDIEAHPSVADRFKVSFEVLNWTNQPAHGLYIWLTEGTHALQGAPPTLVDAAIDPDGRGGPSGGNEIGEGLYNSPAHQSGRGRGDKPGLRNDWDMMFRGPTSVYWGTPVGAHSVPFRNLLQAGSSAGQYILVPGVGTDGLLQPDSAIDGGPPPYAPPPTGQPFPAGGPPQPDGSGNVLDGFVVEVDDFQIGEVLSFNWMLTDEAGESIGSIGMAGNVVGNEMGFGVFNLVRIVPGGSLGAGLFAGNSGFSQIPQYFYGDVYRLPESSAPGAPIIAEFGAEFGATIIAPPLNPDVADEVPASLPIPIPDVDPNVVPPNGGPLPCPNGIPGDVNNDNLVSVVDMQCLILLSLWEITGHTGAIPSCLQKPLDAADLNCSGTINVVDVQLGANYVLELELSGGLDANANGCIDSCDCTAEKCNDGNACTQDSCNILAQCVHVPIGCSDGDECTADACHPTKGCTFTDVGCQGAPGCPRANGDPCNDGQVCTIGDACNAGACVGTIDSCNDGNACTTDSCSAILGCTHTPLANGTTCGGVDQVCIGGTCQTTTIDCQAHSDCNSPPNACKTYECQTLPSMGFSKKCVLVSTLECNDANSCTTDTCEALVGCVYTAVPPTPCDDGDVCTGPDLCLNGTCEGAPTGCDDGNPCSIDHCDPGTACYSEAINAGMCDDANACTENTACTLGHCLGDTVSCDDGNACTADTCDPITACGHTPIVCNDANPCTDDSCSPATGCVYAANQAMCSDGNACTLNDQCAAGACIGGPAPNCNDGNLCTTDTCKPATGCSNAFNAAPCDDGNACTTADACSQGACASGPPLNCNDGNPCTTDTCVPASGCAHATNTAPCEDGDICTLEDHCVGGACVPGAPLICFGAGCPDECEPPPLTVPYEEDFESSSDYVSMGWTATVTPAGMPPLWLMATAAGAGAGNRPTWAANPWLSLAGAGPYTSAFASPVLDASTYQGLTFSFDTLLQTPLGDAVLAEALVSSNGGASWQAVWSRSSAPPALPSERVHVDVSSALGGQGQARLAFRVSGVEGPTFTAWQVDNVSLLPGRPPVLVNIPALAIAAGSVASAALGASDPDTAGAGLTFVVDAPPPFVALADNLNGTAELLIEPTAADVGAYTFTVRVTDGAFEDAQDVVLVVGPPGSGGATAVLSAVLIRNAAGGNGLLVGDLTLQAGQGIELYAAGYDQNLQYMGDVNVVWQTTGSLGPIEGGPSSQVAFVASQPGSIGKIRATHPLVAVVGDETGVITVVPGNAPAPSVGSSVLTASKAALLAGGSDSLAVRLDVRDQFGNPYTEDVLVAFQATSSTLSGSVVENPPGTYSQTLTAPSTPTTIVVTATLNGQAVVGSLSIPVVSASSLVPNGGSVTIDCATYAPLAGQNIVIDGGTVVMDSSGCAPMTFGHVVLRNAATLTHPISAAGQTRYLDLEVLSLSIDSTSQIDVSGKGYPAGLSWGASTALGPCASCGGSYGGRGGRTTITGASGATYGNLDDPRFPGSGSPAAAGGGLVRIRVTDPAGGVALAGSIRANGLTANGGGGAGGGIWLNTPNLSGTGMLQANGGNGQSCCGWASGGGGGGRVALVGLSSAITARQWALGTQLQARGGTGWENAGAGTVFVRAASQPHGALVLDNGGTSSPAGSTVLPAIPEGTIDLLDSDSITDADGTNWIAHRYIGLQVAPNALQGGVTLTDNALFTVTASDAHTLTLSGDPTAVAVEGNTFRTTYVLSDLEIRGQASLHTAADVLVWGGDLASNDSTTFALQGSVATGAFELAGVEDVSLTQGSLTATRLIAHETENFPLTWALVTATLSLNHWSAAYATAKASTIDVGSVASLTDLTLDGTTLTVSANAVDVGGTLSLLGASVLRPQAIGSGPVRRLLVNTGHLHVGAQAVIDASGSGWPAGVGYGGNATLAAKSNSGGSHGGLGARGNGNQTQGVAYDDLKDPMWPGGGAGGGAGTGGGVIRLVVPGTATIQGAIRANGVYGLSGGGAGGAVYVDAGSLLGAGAIEAKGGTGESCCGYAAGGGGGGRVAIYASALGGAFAVPSFITAITTQGGTGWAHGGAGTIYLKRPGQSYGDLIVDNRGTAAGTASTPLPSVAAGQIDAITPTTLTDLSAAFIADGRLVGTTIAPSSPQGSIYTLADDVVVEITSASAITLGVGGGVDLTELAAPGDTYRSLHVFDNLEVRSGARLQTAGDLLVLSGDLSSLDTATMNIGGHIQCETLDVGPVQALQVTDGGLIAKRILAADAAIPPLLVSLTGAATSVDELKAEDVLVSGGTLAVATLTALSDVALDGGTLVDVSADAVEVGGLLGLAGSSTLRHTAASASSPRRLLVHAGSATIGAGSVLDGSGRGWVAGLGFDGTSAFTAKSNSGGSHGGLGARGNGNQTQGYVYDDLRNPTQPGAGAGGGAGTGGGVVHLLVDDVLINNGAIRANGAYGLSGGGAGGSILVKTNALTGTGVIEAKGGAGEACCGYAAGGGGGGRIAIQYGSLGGSFSLATIANSTTAAGGTGWANGGAGTIHLLGPGQVWGDLIVDNEGTASPAGSTPLNHLGTGTIDGLSATTISDLDQSWPSGLLRSVWLNPKVGQGNPDSLADDVFFGITGNAGSLLQLDGDPTAVASAGDSYRSIDIFDSLELRGQARLVTTGDLWVLDGDLSSADDTTFAFAGHLTAHTLDLGGAQAIQATNASLEVVKVQAGGVAHPALPLSLVGTTATVPSLRASELTVSGGAITTGTLQVTGNATLSGAATVDVQQALVNVGGHLKLEGTAVLRHTAAAAGQARSLDVAAGSLTVGTGASIDVSGRGWPSGIGYAGVATWSAKSNSGGSHGGLGARGNGNQSQGIVQGDLRAPTLLGGGAGGGAGTGGGAVKLQVSGTTTIDGAIRANGAYGLSGGGAGGSVWLTAATVTGTGVIEAKGGAGEACCGYAAGGGGGGRIAVHYGALAGGFAMSTALERLDARGGSGWANGGAGTIFLKRPSQVWGDLVVDNEGVNAADGSTPLLEVGAGISEGLDASGLVDLDAAWVPGVYASTRVNPASGQGDPNTLTDDVTFAITDNSATALTLAGDATAVAGAGAPYRSIWTFDNAEIRGLGRLRTLGDLLVLEGDLSSANATTWAFTGTVEAATLDIHQVQTVVATNAKLQVGSLIGDGAKSPAVSYAFTGSTIDIPEFVAGTLTLSGTTLGADTLTVVGDALLNGASIAEIRNEIITVDGTLTLDGTSVLRHPAAAANAPRRLHLTAGNLTIASGASIDVSSRGYPAGLGTGGTTTWGAKSNSGGSHGGLGARGNGNQTQGIAYDSLDWPSEPGAGAGGGAGTGGGAVWVEVPGTLALTGAIRANGAYGLSGGGAGGAITVMAGTITGTGTLEAKGGAGEACCGYAAGGGGGGRLALHYTSLGGGFALATLAQRLDARGGTGWSNAGAGTAFVKGAAQALGDLYVDNKGVNSTTADSTPLNALGVGTWESVTPTTLGDVGAGWRPGAYAGTEVIANLAQGSSTSLTDNDVYEIVDNSAVELEVTGNPTASTAPGASYAGVLRLDRLELAGNAKLVASGAIIVTQGDRHSPSGTFDVPAGSTYKGAHLEFVNIPQSNLTGSITATAKLYCATCP